MKKRFSLLVALVTVIALVGLAGCSSDDGGTNTDRKASNSVIVGISQELDSLDPHNAEYAGTREVLFNMFEGLVKATSTGDIEPAVAKEYTVADDALSISFTLRDGIKFCDGTPVTAADVKYSIERYAEIQAGSSAFSDFKEINIVDDSHVVVLLNNPNTEFIYSLTCAVLPEWNDANVLTNPIGTGPFKYVKYVPGEYLDVAKNEYYWKEGMPYLDAVQFKIVADAKTAILQLNSGTLDIYQYLTADQADTISSDFNILAGNVNYVQGMFLNNKYEPFSDVRVRQAIYYAVDRDLVNNMVFAGKSHIIGTNMIPGASAFYNASTETMYTHDVAKAKELLKEAGYENSLSFTIVVPNNYAPHESTAQIIINSLEEAGIHADMQLVDFTTWYSDVYVDRNYQATVVAVDGRLAPASWFEKNVSTASNNFTNYSNPEFDSEFALAKAAIDLDEKKAHYSRLQEILAEDAASIYVQDPSNLVAVNAQLEGYVFYPVSAQDLSVVKYK